MRRIVEAEKTATRNKAERRVKVSEGRQCVWLKLQVNFKPCNENFDA